MDLLIQISPLIVAIAANRLIKLAKWVQFLPFWKDQNGRLRILLVVLAAAGTVISAGLEGNLVELAQSEQSVLLIKTAFSVALAHLAHKLNK